jgi:hypothetical protein
MRRAVIVFAAWSTLVLLIMLTVGAAVGIGTVLGWAISRGGPVVFLAAIAAVIATGVIFIAVCEGKL